MVRVADAFKFGGEMGARGHPEECSRKAAGGKWTGSRSGNLTILGGELASSLLIKVAVEF